MADLKRPVILVVMGPAGAGKSTVGKAAAELACVPFYEGDDFHPPENVEKIRSGVGLTAEDRVPWISAIAERINSDAPERSVLSCSALNGDVRALLRSALEGELRFVFLDVSEKELLQRLASRVGHFAGPALLKSQLATMDVAQDIDRLDGTRSPGELSELCVQALSRA